MMSATCGRPRGGSGLRVGTMKRNHLHDRHRDDLAVLPPNMTDLLRISDKRTAAQPRPREAGSCSWLVVEAPSGEVSWVGQARIEGSNHTAAGTVSIAPAGERKDADA